MPFYHWNTIFMAILIMQITLSPNTIIHEL